MVIETRWQLIETISVKRHWSLPFYCV